MAQSGGCCQLSIAAGTDSFKNIKKSRASKHALPSLQWPLKSQWVRLLECNGGHYIPSLFVPPPPCEIRILPPGGGSWPEFSTLHKGMLGDAECIWKALLPSSPHCTVAAAKRIRARRGSGSSFSFFFFFCPPLHCGRVPLVAPAKWPGVNAGCLPWTVARQRPIGPLSLRCIRLRAGTCL